MKKFKTFKLTDLKIVTSNPKKLKEYNDFGLDITAEVGKDLPEVDGSIDDVIIYKSLDAGINKIVEDTVLWVSIANDFPVKQIEKPLVYYRVHDGNSVNKGTKSSFSRYEGMKLFFNEPLSNIVSKKVKKEMISDVRFRIAEYYQSKKNTFLAIKFAIHSILTQPSHSQNKMKIFFLLEMLPGFKSIWRKK